MLIENHALKIGTVEHGETLHRTNTFTGFLLGDGLSLLRRFGHGHHGHGNLPCRGYDPVRHHSFQEVGGNLPVEHLLLGTLLSRHLLLGRLGVQLGEGNIVHTIVADLGLGLDGTTELLYSLLFRVGNTVLFRNLHHIFLLVETALTLTELEITRLVHRYEY